MYSIVLTPRTNTAPPNSGAVVESVLWKNSPPTRSEAVKTAIAKKNWSEGTKEPALDACSF